jgi:catechol 1,2-dioxygenase
MWDQIGIASRSAIRRREPARPVRWQPRQGVLDMIVSNEAEVTEAVLQVMQRTHDPRLREIMVSLTRHLHGFIRDVRLTEAELRTAARLINEIGQASGDTHNEAVLLAGSLGVSSLVCLLNNGDNGATETTQNMLGPFWRMNSPPTENGASIVRGETPGSPMFVDLFFEDRRGRPIEGLEVDVWHCSAEGLYENQDDGQAFMNLRGKFTTDAGGHVWFRSIKQSGYPVPTDKVVGKLLAAQGRHPNRPAHIHVLGFKPGLKTLISQVYADDDEHLETDVQFGVTRALVGRFVRHEEPHPEAATPGAWYSLSHTLVMEPGEAVLPEPPIS